MIVYSLAVKFDFKSLAITVAVNNGSTAPFMQTMLLQIMSQRNNIKFLNHD